MEHLSQLQEEHKQLEKDPVQQAVAAQESQAKKGDQKENSQSNVAANATDSTSSVPNKKRLNWDYFSSPIINPTLLNSVMQINPMSLRDGKKAFVIGISGGVSAGKSIITNLVFQALKTKYNLVVANLVQSQFYKDLPSDFTQEQINDHNYDEPNAINWDHLYEALNNLIENKPFSAPVYDMIQEKRSTETQSYHRSADVIIVEGTLVLTQERLRDLYDLKIFLDTDEDVRLSRRMFKSVCIQKKDIDRAVRRYLKFSKVGFEKYTLPSKKYADIIIPNYGGGYSASHTEEILAGFGTVDTAAIEVIINQIVSKLGDFLKKREGEFNQEIENLPQI